MPINLDEPLKTREADPAFLKDLQGNILKGHGRDHTINLFLQFDPANPAEGREFVRFIAGHITSAEKQLEEARRFREEHISGGVFVAFFLTFTGYEALQIEAEKTPADPLFQEGMQNRTGELSDPPVSEWDEHFQHDIHAMLLIGHRHALRVSQKLNEIIAAKPDSVTILGSETGLAMRNTNRDGIEHFGYVDGRSQPLFLSEDIEREADTTDGINVWSPAFPLKQILVPCPGGTTDVSFGSYFVFRKLEQNVKGFKQREKEIAEILELKEKDRELAGAMIIGRFEDGTPVVLQSRDGVESPVPNNFNYEGDQKGLKCPFHAHIRKTNPRGETAPPVPSDLSEDVCRQMQIQREAAIDEERRRIMARRGITYGRRIWENNMINTKLDEDHLPDGGVGLLFMAYQSDFQEQFELTQRFWANNENFVHPQTGLDPIIGQHKPDVKPGKLTQPKKWGKDERGSFGFQSFVQMKGGEYFFAPCISFLESLNPSE